MITYTCDKCGKPVDAGEVQQFERSSMFARFGDLSAFELCPGCYGDLAEWLENSLPFAELMRAAKTGGESHERPVTVTLCIIGIMTERLSASTEVHIFADGGAARGWLELNDFYDDGRGGFEKVDALGRRQEARVFELEVLE